jgi:hypothetical protein
LEDEMTKDRKKIKRFTFYKQGRSQDVNGERRWRMASGEGWVPLGFWVTTRPLSPLCLNFFVYFINYFFIQKKLIFSNNTKIKGLGQNILIEKESNYVYFL